MSTLAPRGERPPVAAIEPPRQSPQRGSSPSSPREEGAGDGRSFAQVLACLGKESVRGEAQVQKALQASGKGRDLSSTELLTLQAGVYRYGEVVDLASRLVDRASTAVKTVIQGQ